jgi:hypothetical protein
MEDQPMSTVLPTGLPSPENSATDGRESTSQSASAGRSRFPVRSVEECLSMLDQLPGMIATRLITPSQANSIRSAINDILAFHQRSLGGSATKAVLDSDLLARLRREPQLMNMLAPLLTAEQIATLMGVSTDGQR